MPVIARLARDARGTSLLEFALTLPIIMSIGCYGVEYGNLSLTSLRVSQTALQLADNASRIGANNGAQVFQLREGDINDVLQGARIVGQGIDLVNRGRITISSLENVQRTYYTNHAGDPDPVQRIHWQRCIGVRSGVGTPAAPLWDSSYGTVSPIDKAGTDQSWENRGTDSAGLGIAPKVIAPPGSGLIFVEVNYEYRPLFGTMFLTAAQTKIHYVGSFIVRDRRDFAQIYNPPTPAVAASTCDKHTP